MFELFLYLECGRFGLDLFSNKIFDSRTLFPEENLCRSLFHKIDVTNVCCDGLGNWDPLFLPSCLTSHLGQVMREVERLSPSGFSQAPRGR